MAKTAVKTARGSHPQLVSISEMNVSPVAQREYRKGHAEEYASDFDIDALGMPVLNKRDGRWYIVDGQHRIEALKLIGYGDQQILCECFEDRTEQQEAEMFLRLNNRRTVRQADQYKVAIVAEREIESDVERIVRANGLRTVAAASGDGSISATKSLCSVYTKHGPKTLARTLRILRDSYGGTVEAFRADTIRGVGLLCARYNGQLDDDATIAKLGHVPGGVIGLRNKAAVIRKQTGRTVDHCVAAAVVEITNAGRGGQKLPELVVMNDLESKALHPSNATGPIQPRDHRVGCLLCNVLTWNANALCDRHQESKEHGSTRQPPRQRSLNGRSNPPATVAVAPPLHTRTSAR